MSETVTYDIVTDSGSIPESKSLEALVIASKQALRRAVMGEVVGRESVSPWARVDGIVSEAVAMVEVDGILDQRFVRALADAARAMSDHPDLSVGARSNLRALSVAAQNSYAGWVANPDLLRGMVWLGIAATNDAARDEEMSDFLALRGIPAPPIRSQAAAYAMRHPVVTATAVLAGVGGILYVGRKVLG